MLTSHKKLIFIGPVGSGKTTAIQSISDVPIVSTNEDATDMTKDLKPETTVAMDYGYIWINEEEKVHLYGTPGQERFSFMWEILTKGALGLILLLDDSRNNPEQDLKFYTQSHKKFLENGELVIGVTHLDDSDESRMYKYREWIDKLSIDAPIFTIDARERSDVSSLVQALLYSLDPRVSV